MSSPTKSPPRDRWTVGELLDWTSSKLEDIGVSDARVDAQYLLAYALKCTRMQLYLQLHRLLDDSERSEFRELVRRRLRREPVAYIEGTRGFHALDLDLCVNQHVLIPRPETEHLVDWALETLAPLDASVHVLDVGTGSGAIALALKRARPNDHVMAIDVSPDALETAKQNAQRLDLAVEFRRSDLLASVTAPPGGFTLVCANLPYIPSADIEQLSPEVRDWEPRLALDGGDDGLRLIERMLDQVEWDQFLAPGAVLLLEFGIGQADAIEQLLRVRGFQDIRRRADYAGITRVIRAAREKSPESIAVTDFAVELDPDPRWLAEQDRARLEEEEEEEDAL